MESHSTLHTLITELTSHMYMYRMMNMNNYVHVYYKVWVHNVNLNQQLHHFN